MRRPFSKSRKRSWLSEAIVRITALWWIVSHSARLYRGWRPWSSHRRRRHAWALRR